MPTDTKTSRLVQLLEKTLDQLVLVESCTAGLVAAMLGQIPGVSSHFAGSMVTYQNRTKAQWLGIDLAQLDRDGAVSADVAQQMAVRGLQQTPHASLAVAITGHLGPGAPPELDGQAYIAIAHRHELRGPVVYSVRLKKRGDTRVERQQRAAEKVIALTTQYLAERLRLAQELSSELAPDIWQELHDGTLGAAAIGGPEPIGDEFTSKLLFPGSFDPLHEGHRQMIAAATKLTGRDVELLLSIDNVDKPSLSREEVLRRAFQFAATHATWIVRPARFWKWATLFPGSTFVIGLDTLDRILNPKYADSEKEHRSHLQTIVDEECRLLAFGRVLQGEFRTASNIKIPRLLRNSIDEIPAAAFRFDIQSRELRSQNSIIAPNFPAS